MRRTAFAVAVLAAASAGAIALSYAQPGPGYGPGYGRGMGGPGAFAPNTARNPAAMAEARLANLRTALNVTAEQEPAWQAFAAVVTQQAQQHQALHEQMTQSTASAPERMALMPQIMQQRAAGMATVSQALNELYAVLTPEQRAIVDQQHFANHGPRGGRWGS